MVKDVEVIISKETTALTKAGFGLPLVIATDAEKSYKLCNDLEGVETAGFNVDSEVYKIAEKVFGQSPSPAKIAVAGIVADDVNATATITADGGAEVKIKAVGDFAGEIGNSKKVEIVSNSENTFSVTYNTDVITIELGGDPANSSDIVTEINTLNHFEAEEKTAGDFVTTDEQEVFFTGGADNSLAGGLNNLINKKNDWYFLLADTQNAGDIETLSDWVLANKKSYVAHPNVDYAGFITLLGNINAERTMLIWHEDETERLDAGLVGRVAPEQPGSITWKFKTIQGATPADVGVNEIEEIHDNNGITYVEKYGVNQTSEGLTTSGEYADVIRGLDWVDARIAEGISRLLFTMPKLPLDVRGISLTVAEIDGVFKQAIENGIIRVDEDGEGIYEITVPELNEISENDRANRFLTGIDFEFELAGAVHKVRVKGRVTV